MISSCFFRTEVVEEKVDGIDLLAVPMHFVMQVGRGTQANVSNLSNDLSPFDSLTGRTLTELMWAYRLSYP